MKILLVAVTVVAIAIAVVLVSVPGAEAATCNPVELSSCLGAIRSGSETPSKKCCGKLKDQKPCLCGYIKNPALKPYVASPNAKRVAAFCRVPTPKC